MGVKFHYRFANATQNVHKQGLIHIVYETTSYNKIGIVTFLVQKKIAYKPAVMLNCLE